MCNGSGACRLYASGTQCAAASCSGSSVNPADTCNGTPSFTAYHATATPLIVAITGSRAFATNDSGVVYQNFTGALIAANLAGATVVN